MIQKSVACLLPASGYDILWCGSTDMSGT